MEFCTIEDAFPDLNSQKTARKEEKRRAKRCKGPALTYLEPDTGLLPVTDPDRPAVKRMSEVSAINPATGLREHAPVTPHHEPFNDMSGEYKELLASLQNVKAPEPLTSVLNSMPTNVAGPTKFEPPRIQVPSFFGAGDDEDDDVNATQSTKEGFASYTNVIGDDPGYKLSPDFGTTFMGKGVSKAGGSTLPQSEIGTNMFWKPLTGSGAKTSFYSKADLQLPKTQPQPMPLTEVLHRLDTIFTRLDDLETRKSENANTEVVLFVMTGLFVMFSMDLLVRKTGNVRLLR